MSMNSDASTPPDNEDSVSKKSELTPIRAHYLKKALIQLQFDRELDLITAEAPSNVSTLSYLGQPFSALPKDVPPADVPFLKYIFRQFVLTFPFMVAAPKDFYSQKLQPFIAALLSRNLSPTSLVDDEGQEEATQKKILRRIERNLTLFLGSATKLVETEEVVRLTQADLTRLEALSAQRQKRRVKSKGSFDINVVSVRTVVEKGRMRNRVHEEFIIRTRRSRYPDVYVSRRYGDFRTLYRELCKAHPEEDIRPPPPKDRAYVKVPVVSPASSLSPTPTGLNPSSYKTYNSDKTPSNHYSIFSPTTPRLSREKNRLTLRSYLHSLLSSAIIASSPVVRSFLLSGPTTLSASELEDAKRREDADKQREEGRKRFAKEIAIRIDVLRDAVKNVKGDIMGKDGLRRFFATIKVTPNIQGLPVGYHSVVEWARVSLASTVYHTFVASDDASESFAGLKRIHSLMPYFMLKTALKISNPVAMIRNVMDLFLATPFGGKSLLQRMFTSSLTEEVKFIEEEIQSVMDKVDDPIMCAKIRQFVYAPRDIQKMFKNEAKKQQMDIITIVLRSAEPPVLSRRQMSRLGRAHKAYTIYLKKKENLADSEEDEGPEDEDGWLIEDLKVLAHLYSKLKDREQLIDLIFEGFTADLLKDILTIFYSPLAQVYRAANIADSLGDLQNFINDLIRTVETSEELGQEDTHTTVQAFIDLIQRHEQAFYTFVHKVHSKGEGLFNDLVRWIELFLTVVREGLGGAISLEPLLPHVGEEREQIISEIDKVALHHYKVKVLYEEKLRRRFGRVQSNSIHSDADAEDEATQELLNSVVGELNFGELVSGDAIDLAAQETDEDSSSEPSSSSDEESSCESDSDELEISRVTPKLPTTSPPASSTSPPASSTSPFPAEYAPQSLHSHPPSVQSNRTTNAALQRSSTVDVPQHTVRRHRSLSLNSVRSLISFNNGSPTRKSHDPPLPVPPLPATCKSANSVFSKTLPERPLPSNPMSEPVPDHSLHTPAIKKGKQQYHSQPKSKKSRKNPEQPLKPPELTLIPQLLPIFVELMRPFLHVAKATK